MKALKRFAIVLVCYVGLVVVFESLLGYFQPTPENTLVITTTDSDGNQNDRVLSRVGAGDPLYVAANHWPRAWYNQALANPSVEIVLDGKKTSHTAVPVTGEEHDRVNGENGLGLGFRFLTGFPPRYLLRLDPR